MEKYPNSLVIAREYPDIPVCILRPNMVKKQIKYLQNIICKYFGNFTNIKKKILFAVKSNPNKIILEEIYKNKVIDFDVASIREIDLIKKQFPDAVAHYLHPIKSKTNIEKAYYEYGIRSFAINDIEELNKIITVLGLKKNNIEEKNTTLIIRLDILSNMSLHSLSGKFGVNIFKSIKLLQKARLYAKNLGISFHVGSQCISPQAFKSALIQVMEVIKTSKIFVDIIDIGGGFPETYINSFGHNLEEYFKEISLSLKKIIKYNPGLKEFWCEPGRYISASASSYLLKIEAKKKNTLYLNDGTYGSLFDLANTSLTYPISALRVNNKNPFSKELKKYDFYGPTCDSIDFISSDNYLPVNINSNDYLEIWQLGAYSQCLKSDFNGFGEEIEIIAEDDFLDFSNKFPMRNSNIERHEILNMEKSNINLFNNMIAKTNIKNNFKTGYYLPHYLPFLSEEEKNYLGVSFNYPKSNFGFADNLAKA